MERVTTMNQLPDMRNKSAESLKTNNNKKQTLFSDYVVRIGAFLYERHVHCGNVESEKALLINN